MAETYKNKEDPNIKRNPKAKDKQKTPRLKECFTNLVDRKQVSLDMDALRIILKNELSINVESLDENLTSVLPFMLVFYIQNWPGWQKSKEYYSGKLIFREWFEKFRQYVVVKINYVIKNGYNVALGMIKDEWKQTLSQHLPRDVIDRGAQTDHSSSKIFAPFSISIQGPPTLIGSIRFDVDNEDIYLRHNKEIPMTEIGMTELLNWPYVSVEFISPELSFKRSNCLEHTRFLSMSTSNKFKKPDFIEHVEMIDPSNGRHCYTARLLKGYIKQYMTILKLARDIPSLTIKKYETILVEFLKDIDEIGMNATMATNTSVLFNIGKNLYFRTRRSDGYPSVTYYEQYTPKMETSLYYFKGIQDTTTPEISFSYLNILQASVKNMNNTTRHLGQGLPTVKYGCNFCTNVFNADQILLAHLKDCHKFEPNLKCVKCGKLCSIKQLASSRWQHNCQENVK